MFSTRLTVPTVAGALALALGLAACGSAEGGTDSSSGPIKIGVVVPLTGPFSPLGIGDKAAIEQEVDPDQRRRRRPGTRPRGDHQGRQDRRPAVGDRVQPAGRGPQLHRDPVLVVRLGLDRVGPERREQQDPDHRPRAGQRLRGRLQPLRVHRRGDSRGLRPGDGRLHRSPGVSSPSRSGTPARTSTASSATRRRSRPPRRRASTWWSTRRSTSRRPTSPRWSPR